MSQPSKLLRLITPLKIKLSMVPPPLRALLLPILVHPLLLLPLLLQLMPLLVPLRVMPLVPSPLETTRMVDSPVLRLLMLLLLRPRKPPSMPALRLLMIRLPRPSLKLESREISMPLPLPRLPLMPTLRPTKRELLLRRINWREDKTKIDSSSSTRIPLPRPPKFRANMTKEREPMPNLELHLLPSDDFIQYKAKSIKLKIINKYLRTIKL